MHCTALNVVFVPYKDISHVYFGGMCTIRAQTRLGWSYFGLFPPLYFTRRARAAEPGGARGAILDLHTQTLHTDNRLFRSLSRQPSPPIIFPFHRHCRRVSMHGLKLIVPTRGNQWNTVACYGPREVSLSNGLINTEKVCWDICKFSEYRSVPISGV